jgi:hypothetical protein
MGDMVTERHHGAVRMITKEIIMGRHGKGLIMMDAGKLEKRKRDGVNVAYSIPEKYFPKSMSGKEKARMSRTLKPDVLIKINPGGRKRLRKAGEPMSTVRIVEVKYCKDTDRSKQEARAEGQHEKLAGLIRETGREVQQHTILLGVGGTIYSDTMQHLTELGVDKERAVKLLKKLSKYAVDQMHKIVKTRRAMESEALKASGKQPQWKPKGKKGKAPGHTAPPRKRGEG